jgi:hypothetical protein
MLKTITKTALIGAFCALTSTAALAVEVKKEVILGTDAATAWNKVSSWCAIANWHPAVAKCQEMKKGDDLFRTLTLGDGAKVFEKFTNRTKSSYSYTILESPLPVTNYAATFSITPEGKKSKLTWSTHFDAKGKTDEEAAGIIAGIFQAGLDAIQKDLGK